MGIEPDTTTAAFASPVDAAPTGGWLTRLVWLSAIVATWPVIALSVWLRPDPRGFGTHQQLGLPPCNFSEASGIPCPGCGLTTSFTLMAHGHPLDAFGAHLMGPPLFLLTLATALGAPWALRRALVIDRVIAHPWTFASLSLTLALGLATFALRLAHQLSH